MIHGFAVVAASVEAVARGLAAGCRDGADAAEFCEGGLRSDPFGIVAENDQHLRDRAGGAAIRAGAWWQTNLSSTSSSLRISASRASHRRASMRSAVVAEAVVEEMGPGRKAANARISVIGPVMAMNSSRSIWGALTMRVLSVTITWVRAFNAVSRAIFRLPG